MVANLDVWAAFGFNDTPYRIDPLEATRDDYDLFVGRRDLGIEFRTQIECSDGCLSVLSGNIGVGKTSFFNAQQYLLFSGEAEEGPRLLPSLHLTSIMVDDDASTLARRITYNAIQSIKEICASEEVPPPKIVAELDEWMSQKARTGKGGSVGIFGFQVSAEEHFHLPPVESTTLEQWRDILRNLSREIRKAFAPAGYQGFFVAIDNLESIASDKLATILMAYRDSLFRVGYMWWVLIGPPGLHGLLETTDKRVAQAVQGGGVEIDPLSAEELHEAIDRRIKRFRARDAAVSPISYKIHDLLYLASRGELRFVLKLSDELVRGNIAKIRAQAKEEASTVNAGSRKRSSPSHGYLSNLVADKAGESLYTEVFKRVLSDKLFDGRLRDDLVEEALRAIVEKRLAELRSSDLALLAKIGDAEMTYTQAKDCGFQSEEQFESVLERLFRSGYLHRRLSMQQQYYSLNGIAALAERLRIYEIVLQRAGS